SRVVDPTQRVGPADRPVLRRALLAKGRLVIRGSQPELWFDEDQLDVGVREPVEAEHAELFAPGDRSHGRGAHPLGRRDRQDRLGTWWTTRAAHRTRVA